MKTISLIFVLLLLASPLLGGRTVIGYPIKLTSVDQPGSPRSGGSRITVSCQNLSDVSQELNIQLLSESMKLHLCVNNRENLSGWISKDPTGCHIAKTVSFPERKKKMVLAAAGSPGDEGVWTPNKDCVFMTDGPDCSDDALASEWDLNSHRLDQIGAKRCLLNDGTTQIKNCVLSGDVTFTSKIRIDVTEDKGAVICGAQLSAHLSYARDIERGYFAYGINGGRPF